MTGEILTMEPPIAIDEAVEEMTANGQYVRHGQLLLPLRYGMFGDARIDYCIYRSGAVKVLYPSGVEPVIEDMDVIGFRLSSQHRI
jgi:hypothetical protein